MQLDADEEEDQPFFQPQPIQTEPLVPRTGPGDAGGTGGAVAADEDPGSQPSTQDEQKASVQHSDEDTQESGEAQSEETASTDG